MKKEEKSIFRNYRAIGIVERRITLTTRHIDALCQFIEGKELIITQEKDDSSMISKAELFSHLKDAINVLKNMADYNSMKNELGSVMELFQSHELAIKGDK